VHPRWLEPRWDSKRRETATRIEAAVNALRKDGVPVTYSSICETVNRLYRTTISPNTIKRNHSAYQIYLSNRHAPKRGQLAEPILMEMIRNASVDEQKSLRLKTARLRRERKDALIAKLISLERAVAKQKGVEIRLRDEILRLSEIGPK
jgi:hypothetical protein